MARVHARPACWLSSMTVLATDGSFALSQSARAAVGCSGMPVGAARKAPRATDAFVYVSHAHIYINVIYS